MKSLLPFVSAFSLGWAAFADSANFTPIADTTISDGDGARANGFSTDMIVGRLSHLNAPARGLVRFDLSGLPVGAVVTSVSLNFTVIANASGGADIHALQRLNTGWLENSATWLSSGAAPWANAGGDYLSTPDATVSVTDGTFTFSSTAALVGTVQAWIDNPASNNGWLLRSQNEGSGRNARRIGTLEGSSPPILTVEYSAPPAADFNVTSPGFFFSINGQSPNPPLTLTRGSNYLFSIDTDSIHPFGIASNLAGAAYSSGVSNNNIFNGFLAFHVPVSGPDTLYYVCTNHLFGATIQIVDPPPPPPPPDFSVITPGSYYVINSGDPNPTLTLTRGVTYTFFIDADASHPFEIVSDLGGIPWDEGVVNNNISSGLLTFAVPWDAPELLYYICSVHFFGGEIHIVDPPPAPLLVRILSIEVDTSNVVMTSLGTNGNGWLAIPEFSSNLVSSNWAIVPSYSNSFTAGTNTTTFNRLDPICGPNVFLRIKNVKN